MSDSAVAANEKPTAVATAPKPLLKIADYILSSSAKLKTSSGSLNGVKIQIFKGMIV